MASSETEFAASGFGGFGGFPGSGLGGLGYGYQSRGYAPSEVGLFTQQGLSDTRFDVTAVLGNRIDLESFRTEMRDSLNRVEQRSASAVAVASGGGSQPTAPNDEVIRLRAELESVKLDARLAEMTRTITDAIRDSMSP